MKNRSYIYVIILCVSVTGVFAEKDAVDELIPDTRSSEVSEGADTNDVNSLELEPAGEAETAMKPPTMRDLATSLKSVQSGVKSDVYQVALDQLELEDLDDIKDLFLRFREKDKDVAKEGLSREGESITKAMNAASFKKNYGGADTRQGSHFVCIFPKEGYIVNPETKKPEKVDADRAYNIATILSRADGAFASATEMVLMNNFMYWPGKTRGKIYVIPTKDMWEQVRKGRPKEKPVQMVIYNRDTREFFILVTPETQSEAAKAIAYAVAQCVLEEYSMVKGKERSPKLPLVVLTGMAGNIAELDSVLSEDGPRQLEKYTFGNKRRNVTGKIIQLLREKQNNEAFQLPLNSRDLIDADDLVRARSYPDKLEDVYYYVRQSKALVKYLQENGQLPYLLMVNTMTEGEEFEKAFDDIYVKVRDEITGKNEGKKKDAKKPKTRKEAEEMKEARENSEDTLAGFKELEDEAEDVIFYPLTAEAMKEEKMEERSERKRNR